MNSAHNWISSASALAAVAPASAGTVKPATIAAAENLSVDRHDGAGGRGSGIITDSLRHWLTPCLWLGRSGAPTLDRAYVAGGPTGGGWRQGPGTADAISWFSKARRVAYPSTRWSRKVCGGCCHLPPRVAVRQSR
jgi:hypothetical protein